MRYLKYFEASGWTDFISRLSDDQFKRRVANKKFIDLSQKEQSAIIDMLKPKIFSEDVSLSFNIRMTKDGQKMSRISYRNYDMMIYKEEKDDWYYVLSGRDLFNPNLIPSFHPLYLSRNGLVTKRLECDQFDGLLRMISEFLEFIQNKKNESFDSIFEAYSEHKYHHEKLDDLLDTIQPVLDEFDIVESGDRLFVRRHHMGQELPLKVPVNYRFSYAKDNPHIKDYDGVIISCINNFEKGQQILKKLESMAPRIEKLVGCGIGIQTSDMISTPLLKYEYIRFYKETGEDPGHPYIKIYLNPEENFSGIRYV